MINEFLLDEMIRNGLKEDIHHIDVTTDHLIDDSSCCRANVLAKAKGVIAGLPVLKRVFEFLDQEVVVTFFVNEGDDVNRGDKIAMIEGRTKAILKGERLALNLIQRMSGIATLSREYSELVKDFPVKIVDTRKTTPGLRALEKYAVRVGGCYNHRYNLSDAVLIKDNHIRALGGIQAALSKIREKVSITTKIEVEVQNLQQLKEAMDCRADIIMLDNMTVEEMKEAVKLAKGKVLLEASGGITKEKLIDVAKTGVDMISVGALTHSVKALDISLNIE